MADKKLDIFEAMAAVDRKDGDWFMRQPEDARKTLAPPVFLRWTSAITDGKRAASLLINVNDRVNAHMWDMATTHPELVFRLAATCGKGRVERHQWIALPKRAATVSKALALILDDNPGANNLEANMLLSLHTKDSFAAWVDARGLQPAEVKEVIKSYVKFHAKDEDISTKENKARRGRSESQP